VFGRPLVVFLGSVSCSSILVLAWILAVQALEPELRSAWLWTVGIPAPGQVRRVLCLGFRQGLIFAADLFLAVHRAQESLP
jgi:hypothetical protein